ncbi:Cytosine permease [Sodalis glossinidius str. 'morsitans']|uniref:Cytosine permease n=1 Tax=Sodalis glossinidius (strain morsitans) TaxID=343509 RepID=Q2NWX9_SODGM|nr:cytosine permease [Sodalis glossinidius]BAE73346.1 cytosine transport protein [Sodalis glossinidius str. 'morsitans']CRL43667.1 Cytosine permease [Sodalis glossinidius str. 'morsitans']
MHGAEIHKNDHAYNRVPAASRASLLNATLVRMGVMTSLSQFMVGATLGHSMTFGQAMLATVLGSLILEMVSLGMGLVGMNEGLSTSLLARWCGFGRVGSCLIGIVIALSLIGWFGVQNSVLAEGLVHASQGILNFPVAAILSGLIITLLVLYGFSALSWTAKMSVPLFFLVVLYILYGVVSGADVLNCLNGQPGGPAMSLSEGATMVAGGYIVGALISPDICRYCKNKNHVLFMVTASIIVGEIIINCLSVIVAHALGTADVVTIMTHSAGGIGLVTVILSAIKVNDVNLYSASLGMATALDALTHRKWHYRWLTLLLGLTGTTLSVMGIIAHFIDFLIFLGVLFPPIAGIMLVDYYVLRTHRALLDATRARHALPDVTATPVIGWSAVAAWLGGSAVGLTCQLGIPSLNALLAGCLLYWLMVQAKQRISGRCRSDG